MFLCNACLSVPDFSYLPDFRTYAVDIPAEARSYKIENLPEPDMEYSFRVAAKNDIGLGKYSNVRNARTSETGELAQSS